MKPAIISLLLLALCAALPAAQVGDPMEDKGTLIPLDNGLKLQLVITEDHRVAAYFIDDKNLVAESPADSIVFAVAHPGNRNDEFRTILVKGEDAGMIAPRTLYPPYQLKTRLIIRYKEGDPETIPYAMVQLNRNVASASGE